ncbi:hypothetical protein K438DRAFT_1772427 [Mycena galopus ATCC 62051]|nr:hypothetical protein K438DRAFT_1772427 [Mycena galopus ATCC 62051]
MEWDSPSGTHKRLRRALVCCIRRALAYFVTSSDAKVRQMVCPLTQGRCTVLRIEWQKCYHRIATGSAQTRKPSRAGPRLQQAGTSPTQGLGGPGECQARRARQAWALIYIFYSLLGHKPLNYPGRKPGLGPGSGLQARTQGSGSGLHDLARR